MSDTNQLHAILERHCASLPGEIASAREKFAEAILAPARYRELARDVVEIIHRLNGSSGSLGFRTLSTTAEKFENALNESLQTGAVPDEAEIRRLHSLLDEMRQAGEQTRPESSQLFGLDIAAFGQKPAATA